MLVGNVNIDNFLSNESKSNRGYNCSIYGKKYELQVYNIVKKCKINNNDMYFNTQNEHELGGCNFKNDIECNLYNEKDIAIEIKKSHTPDWMQCVLNYDTINNKWIGSSKNVIPEKSKKLFEDLLSNVEIFNNQIPPFINKNITHAEWKQIKKETKHFNDMYIDCPNDTIQKLYSEKGCKYIQISDKGLYHLGHDICDFNVPNFICEQHLRIRTKIHKSKNSKGFCKMSVIVACKPKHIKSLTDSKYSLDIQSNLPINLIYTN